MQMPRKQGVGMRRPQKKVVEPSAVGADDPAEASSGDALPPHSQVALSDA